jgi:hypothetical protein
VLILAVGSAWRRRSRRRWWDNAAMAMRSRYQVVLSDEQRRELTRLFG